MVSLSSRKEEILKAVIDSYIDNPSPVSSKEIQASHMPDISSATIRNELAALEKMGYLVRPHVSGGAMPTSEAYKLYVEKLMPPRKLTAEELSIINKRFNSQLLEIKDILKRTVKVVSEVTHYASVAFAGKAKEAVVKDIKLARVSERTAHLIVATNMGVIRDAVIEAPEDMGEAYYEAASRLAVKTFRGRTVSEILRPRKVIKKAVKEYKFFFDSVMRVLTDYFSEDDPDGFFIDGVSDMLERPEYDDVEKARAVLRLLDAKEKLYPLLKSAGDGAGFDIRIGRDNGAPDECAVVTAGYSINGKTTAKAGVIGPIGMNYPLVVSVLDYIGKTLKGNGKND